MTARRSYHISYKRTDVLYQQAFQSPDVLDSPSLFATLLCHLVRHQWSVTKLAIVWIDCAKSLHRWISIDAGHKSGAWVKELQVQTILVKLKAKRCIWFIFLELHETIWF